MVVRASIPFLAAGLLTVALAGCAATDGLQDALEAISPFGEKEKILTGERKGLFEGADPADGALKERKPVSVPASRSNADWPQPGGTTTNNPGHLALRAGGAGRAWRTKVASAGKSSSYTAFLDENIRMSSRPIVYQGRVIVYDPNGTVSSNSLANGGRVWRTSLRPEGEADPAPGGGVAADGGLIYAATGYGAITALHPANGKPVWTTKLEAPARSAPTAAGGNVYVVTQNNVVMAVKGDDGTQLWAYRGIPETAGLMATASPAVVGSTVVVPFSSGEVVAIDVKSGEPEWADTPTRSYRTSAVAGLSDVSASPVIDGRTVYATGIGGRTIAIDLSSGNRIWEQNVGGAHTPALAGSALYLVDLDDRLVALSRKDGSVMWATQLPVVREKRKSTHWAGPVLASNALWLVSSDGKLIQVGAATGNVMSTRKIGDPSFISPIVASGKLLVLSGSGTLTALN